MKRRAVIAGLAWAGALGWIVALVTWPTVVGLATAFLFMAAFFTSCIIAPLVVATCRYIRGDR